MKKKVDWNINNFVTVKLTEHGLELLKEHNKQFEHIRGNKERTEQQIAKVIENEYHLRLQGWDMMHIFGQHCYLGSRPIFELCNWEVEVEE